MTKKNLDGSNFLVFPHCAHSAEKREILSHQNFFPWNQFFSNFFSKNVAFTNFFVKMCESEVPWIPHCENKRDNIQKFPWNQPFSNSFTKTVDLTEKMLIFFVKIVFLRLFTLLCEYFSISNHKFLSKLNSRNFSEQPINLFFVYTADG